MSKIMDRLVDIQAVNWAAVPTSTLAQWECEALYHHKECRCEKCALFFARMAPEVFQHTVACAIGQDVISALRGLLQKFGKL